MSKHVILYYQSIKKGLCQGTTVEIFLFIQASYTTKSKHTTTACLLFPPCLKKNISTRAQGTLLKGVKKG